MEEIAGKRNRRKGWKKKMEAMQERQNEIETKGTNAKGK